MLYSNLDSGLNNKRDEISHIISTYNPDILIFNEILPKQLNKKRKLSANDFNFENYDYSIPSFVNGRGVCIYHKTNLSVTDVELVNSCNFNESVWIRLKLKGTDSLLIGSVYRSPSSPSDNNDQLNNIIREAVQLRDTHLLIAGDFNYGSIDWDLMQSTESIDHPSSKFVECVNDTFLCQHVLEETRFRHGQRPSRLDLVLTNESNMITDLEYLPPIGASDHACLVFNYICYADTKKSQEERFNFHKGDYTSLRSTLGNYDWNVIETLDVEGSWELFSNRMAAAIDQTIPKHKPSNKTKKKPWLNKDAIIAIEAKVKAWKIYLMCKTKQNFQKYAELRNKATRECRNARFFFEQKLSENIKSDSKSFWNYVRAQSKTKSGISDLESSDGTMTTSDLEKAELLNSFFSSVFTNENTTHIPELAEREFHSELNNLNITPETVAKKLSKLNASKSPGIDAIHPKVLKECCAQISNVLSSIFNKTILAGTLPSIWKCAQVTPIFKKGSKKQCGNYRPVSLTVVLCKVLESIIRDSVMLHMESNDLFTEHQHGFRSKRSCVTQLLEVMEEWSEILDSGGNIDNIYLDFSKAFDTVPHKRLKNKLYSYGIRGQVLNWIVNFLQDRKQQVRIGAATSNWADVLSGIPQGSVLGPTLFLIYINDLPEVVHNIAKLFADDTKLYKQIVDDSSCISIQDDLNELANWSEKWQLKFNAGKCKAMHLGRSNPNWNYSMKDNVSEISIENITNEKDLGVVFDNDLSFDTHIAQKVKKANQMLGLIKRTFTCLNKDIFLPLYKSLIRPQLEYATTIWYPRFRKDIISIENVQRRATRVVKELNGLTYEERIRELGLPTLYYRRDRADMIQLFKIMNSFDIVTLPNIKLSENTQTRGHSFKLSKQNAVSRQAQNRFSNRVVNPWNDLPEDVVHAKSVNSFKSGLNIAWKHKANKFEI